MHDASPARATAGMRLGCALAASVAALACAPSTRAADTGMLYVKSSPPGATVVIKGKARGKTPVLVKDLPAGDVTVELRVAGAEPVTRRATVSANKVVTIEVTIEVPSATLTVISDPLEAKVLIDKREVGRTPVTLGHLEPGRHTLVLLKDGYPQTARSVVLEPGGESVLEVKLGTAAGDGAARPAAGESAARAAKPVPVEVQLILTMLKDAVASGDYAETRRNMGLALSQPDMANFEEELRAGIEVVRALEARQDAVRKGAESLVGREVTLQTTTGPRKGRVKGVSVEGIAIATKIVVARRAVGETSGTIAWSALAPEEQDRLAESWKPEGPDGAVALAILALARKDAAAAARAAGGAGGHPLGRYLGRNGEALADEAAERAARSAWSGIKGVRPSSIAGAEKLSKKIADFEEKHGRTRFASSIGEEIAALKRYASLVSKVPRDAARFGGHWYKLYQQAKSWHEAKEYCEQVGGHLVTVTTADEHKFVLGLHHNTKSTRTWIGLTDEDQEGKWEWVTGEKLVLAAWRRGEPSGGEQHCAQILTRDGKTGWDDLEAHCARRFICEWEP